jgi:alkanesulfonate monooxygenase SsuD/methylene tetrahydromethanopterin reductase-like flavin-dependent oxidoreductase (luciferase family)
MLGLPYAFASHFSPQALHQAIRIYRESFQPSTQLDRPYVIVGANVFTADTDAQARNHLEASRRARVRNLFSRGEQRLNDDDVDAVLRSPQAAHIDQMLTYSAVGTPETVVDYLDEFQRATAADELIVVHHAPAVASRLRSVELLAEAANLA